MSVANEGRQVTVEVLDWAIAHLAEPHVRADVLHDVRAAGDDMAAVAMAAADSIARQLTELRDTYIRVTEESAINRARHIASAQCLRVHRVGENCGRPTCTWQGRIAGVATVSANG